jgi:hypothetical protein
MLFEPKLYIVATLMATCWTTYLADRDTTNFATLMATLDYVITTGAAFYLCWFEKMKLLPFVSQLHVVFREDHQATSF